MTHIDVQKKYHLSSVGVTYLRSKGLPYTLDHGVSVYDPAKIDIWIANHVKLFVEASRLSNSVRRYEKNMKGTVSKAVLATRLHVDRKKIATFVKMGMPVVRAKLRNIDYSEVRFRPPEVKAWLRDHFEEIHSSGTWFREEFYLSIGLSRPGSKPHRKRIPKAVVENLPPVSTNGAIEQKLDEVLVLLREMKSWMS